MSRDSRICGAPQHVGERVPLHISELFEIRKEARRMSDQGRERTRTLYRACRDCMRAEYAEETVQTGTLL
jgi:hypothetical protein